MTAIRLIARPMLASMFVMGGIDALTHASPKVAKAEKVTEKVPTLVERLAPGLPVPTERAPRTSSLVLAASLAPTTYAGHSFWEEKDKAARAGQRIQFFKNVSMMGGLLLAGVDTEGKPGVAWRARRAARDVRREARQLARQARTEARVAKAHLS
jgi:putative oxidoreductase